MFEFCVCVFLLSFFFSPVARVSNETNSLFTYYLTLFMHYFSTIHTLFMRLTVTLLKKYILKMESHGTIHTFKIYFVTVFSVLSFQFQQK